MTTTTAHRHNLERCELPNLTRQVGELVVVELVKKSVLTTRGEAAHVKRLERPEATDLRRNRDQAVVLQLHTNPSATSDRRRRLTFTNVSCVMANTQAGISVKALFQS